MVTKVSVADLTVSIAHEHTYLSKQCASYLTDAPADFSITVTPEMIKRERAVSLEISASDGYCESIAAYREIARRLPEFDAILFHAAVIEVDGKAFAFTAKSGTGKSTHIRLWRRVFGESVGIVNGDKPILRFGSDGVLRAYGTPWAGKEGWHRNIGVPLSAIVVLERGAADKILTLSKADAATQMLTQILLGDEPTEALAALEMLDRVLHAVETKILYCTPTEEAARVAYAALVGEVD